MRLHTSYSILALLILPIAFCQALDASGYHILPSLNAGADIGVAYWVMTDRSRLDPFADKDGEFRQAMVSVFYPVLSDLYPLLQKLVLDGYTAHEIPYMPTRIAALYGQLLAPSNVSKIMLQGLSPLCHLGDATPKPLSSYPLVTFSSGGGLLRFLYTTIYWRTKPVKRWC